MAGLLDGRVAIVTGGGSGIGEAIARAFADAGADVVVSGRRAAPLEAVAADIGGLAVAADVSREDDVIALMAACDKAFGRLHILVNNAGQSGPTAAAEHMDLAAWDATYAVNVRGLMLCTKHAVPHLRAAGGGAIINIGSRVGFKANPFRSCYSSTKFAVRGITESVAREVGRDGIRVNAICPGATDTVLFRDIAASKAAGEGRSVDAHIRENFLEGAALDRLVAFEDVAATAVFLASDQASAITGEAIKIDAGRA